MNVFVKPNNPSQTCLSSGVARKGGMKSNERREGAVEPPHIGGGRVGVDVSFGSFLCAKEKRNFCIFND